MKRLWVILLAVIMIFTCIPASASAEEPAVINIDSPDDWAALGGDIRLNSDTVINITTSETNAGLGIGNGFTTIISTAGKKITVNGTAGRTYRNLAIYSYGDLAINNLNLDTSEIPFTPVKFSNDAVLTVSGNNDFKAAGMCGMKADGALTVKGIGKVHVHNTLANIAAIEIIGKLSVESGTFSGHADNNMALRVNNIDVLSGAALKMTSSANSLSQALYGPPGRDLTINNDGTMECNNLLGKNGISTGGSSLIYSGNGSLSANKISAQKFVQNGGTVNIFCNDQSTYALTVESYGKLSSGNLRIYNAPKAVLSQNSASGPIYIEDGMLSITNGGGQELYPSQLPGGGTWELENAELLSRSGIPCSLSDETIRVSIPSSATANIKRDPNGLSVDKNSVIFPSSTFGHPPLSPAAITIENKGVGDVEDINVELAGTNAGAFIMTQTDKTHLAESESTSFTVVPKNWLPVIPYVQMPLAYSATVNVKAGNKVLKSIPLSFMVTRTMTNQLYKDTSGTYNFGILDLGYSTVPPKTVTLYNCGTNAITNITLRLLGGESSNFILSGSSLPDLPSSDAVRTFTVRPKDGLPQGTYTDTVEIKAAGGMIQRFDVKLEVQPLNRLGLFELPEDFSYTFPSEYYLNQTQHEEAVSIENQGFNKVVDLGAESSNTDAFTATISDGPDMEPGDQAAVLVKPKPALSPGTYTSTITATGANGAETSFPVSYTVKATPTFGMSIAGPLNGSYGQMDAGYNPPPERTFTVMNIGSGQLTSLNASLIGSGADKFEISAPLSSATLNSTQSSTVKVKAKPDLPPGIHKAQLKIAGDNGVTKIHDISFSVIASNRPNLVMNYVNYNFPGATDGYSSTAPVTVKITNRGGIAATGITASFWGGSATGAFTCSALPKTQLAPLESMYITVKPKLDLTSGGFGSHDKNTNLRIQDSSGNRQDMYLSFIVSEASYSMALDKTGTIDLPMTYTGNTNPAKQAVEISNTGTGKISDIEVSGNNGNLDIEQPEQATVYPENKISFSVKPKSGLPAGTYITKVTVDASNGLTEEFDVRFVVGHQVSVKTNNTSYGTVGGEGIYANGSQVTFTATPKPGYRFVRWMDGTGEISRLSQITLSINAPHQLTAEFAAIPAPSVKSSSAAYNKIKLSWTKVIGANGYILYRYSGSSKTYAAIKTIIGGDITNYIDSGCLTGTTYNYKVRAFWTVSGKSVYGGYSAAVSGKAVLSAPASVKARPISSGKIKLTWKAVPGRTKYVIYRSKSLKGSYKKVGITSKRTFTNKKLAKNRKYYYKVRAYRVVNGKKVYSKYSKIVRVKTR